MAKGKITSDLEHVVLVIAGHGSSRNPQSAEATSELTASLATSGVFKNVLSAFVKQEPKLADVLATINADTIVIVPNMTCRGYITTTVIPRDGVLSGARTERPKPDGSSTQRLFLTEPIGTDERISEKILSDIRTLMKTNGLTPEETGVLVIGHGSEKSRESFNQTEALARAISTSNIALETATAFLEEAPAIPTWAQRMKADKIIAVPFLIAAGLHGRDDIPSELGIKDTETALKSLNDEGQAGPFTIGDRDLWYLRPIGNASVIADIVIDRAKEALEGD